ncbi:MAG TPA: phosphodiester glycosidase family protein, partial [Thermoanaerobaculia bacterium]
PIGKAGGACGLWAKGANVRRNQGLVTIGRGRVEIQRNTQKVRPWMRRGAVSGWPMLVQGCAAIRDLPGSDFFTRTPLPRTAAATSKDGRMLYFVVVDQATLPQLAELLVKDVGACAAMNLDGGSSTTMWAGSGIVYRPADGVERKVGNHLAVVGAADYRGCERK